MTSRSRRAGIAAATALACAAAAATPASASQALLDTALSGAGTAAVACQLAPADGASGVVTRTVRSPVLGVVTARLNGGVGDWDLAVFDKATRRLVGASAAVGTRELAQGFAFAGRDLLVQACRGDGAGARPRLTV